MKKSTPLILCRYFQEPGGGHVQLMIHNQQDGDALMNSADVVPLSTSAAAGMTLEIPGVGRRCCGSWLSKFPTRAKRIDVISRITFPIVFALFNFVYWSTYLSQENDDPVS